MNLNEKTLEKHYTFRGKIINVRQDRALLPNGHIATRDVVEHKGGVCVVPLCDNGDVILVRQFRYPYLQVVTEIPAGKRDSADEIPLKCGKRELKEEIGATAENYIDLGELYPSPGYCDEVIYMYLATGLTFGETHPDEDEFLKIERMPLQQAVDMVLRGEIKDAKTQAALLKTYYLQNK